MDERFGEQFLGVSNDLDHTNLEIQLDNQAMSLILWEHLIYIPLNQIIALGYASGCNLMVGFVGDDT
jgi:predicted esterase